jgi:hypothetical protein
LKPQGFAFGCFLFPAVRNTDIHDFNFTPFRAAIPITQRAAAERKRGTSGL